MKPVNSSTLGEPVPGLPTLPEVPLLTSALRTCSGVAVGLRSRYSAAAPATCGEAIEVPLMVLVALVPVFQAEVMLSPGAKMSMQVPVLENQARESTLLVAPTVMAAAARAGEKLHASTESLPAAIAYVTPALMERMTASSIAWFTSPPRLMLATAGGWKCAVTQSTPRTTPASVPEPWQSSTRTACSVTPFARPHVLPPTVPATCVPWPWQSSAEPP